MTLAEAIAAGISRVRLAKWANPDDHLELVLLPDGGHGAIATLHSPAAGRIADELRASGNAEEAKRWEAMVAQPMLMVGFDLDADNNWERYEPPQ
jgi:hypothetical protein